MSYNTKQKQIILNIIKQYNTNFTINDIYNKTNKSVGLTTIYRLIDKLILDGLVNKYIDGNYTYYEYLGNCTNNNHFYLKCNKCKRLIHVDCDCISDLYNHIYKKHNFIMNKNKIIINGICDKCNRGDKLC